MPEPKLPKTFFSFIWFFLRKQWKTLLFIQIFSFAWSIDHTLWPFVIMKFIDGITNYSGPKSAVWHVLSTPIIMGVVLWFIIEIFFRLSGILLAKFIPKLEADVRMSMFSYVLNHSHHYFSNRMAGEIANKISDMPQSITRFLMLVVQLFIPVGLALIIATTLFTMINPIFGLILMGWFAVHIAACLAFAGSCSNLSDIHSSARSRLMGKIVDALTNNTNIRLFARNQFEKQYLAIYQEDELKKHENSLWVVEKLKLVLGILSFLGALIGINWYMIYSWQQDQLSVGEVVFIFNTMWNIMMMAWLAGLELPNLYKEIGICRQALSIIQDDHEVTDKKNTPSLVVSKGKIEFQNVSFSYKDAKHEDLFQNKSLIIHPGEKVGLVGFSGSGKTTFVNLILRYFDINKGRILIDDQDISKVSQESLRSYISMIPQDPSLFHRSLMENIRYGNLDASDEDVIEASKKARCHDFILKQPYQYDTLVGERGLKLSGGQRQRIAIARAILKNSPILILDEATSALDSVTEKEIQEGLNEVMKNQTVIVIAHRLSTLSGMDRILVFHKGKIVEQGTHEQLLAKKGHYTRLWQMQVGGYIPV